MSVEIKGKTLREMFMWIQSAVSAGAKAITIRASGKEITLRPEKISTMVYNDDEFPTVDIYLDNVVVHLGVKEKEDDKEKIEADVEPLVPVKK